MPSGSSLACRWPRTRKARISMMARTESRVACVTASGLSGAPACTALSLTLPATFASIVPQSPSSAETSSPLAAIGQFFCVQEAPSALLITEALSSFSSRKKSAHSGVTELASVS